MKFITLIPFWLWLGAIACAIAYGLWGFVPAIIVGLLLLFALA